MARRVGILGIQHESNTFFAAPTTLDSFKQFHLFRGDEIGRQKALAHHEMSGFSQGLEENDIEVAPLFFASAMPSGAVAEDALDKMLAIVFEELDKAGTLDGLLVAPHGAGVSEKHRDMDGYWLTLLREKVGRAIPIICTLDAHANLSRKMIDACDATIAYRTNPHIDQKACGLEAAHLMARTLRGEAKPVQAAAFPPVAINIERQNTSVPPCLPMYELADRMIKSGGRKVLSNSVILGFPYADVEEMGSAFAVVTDNDPALAQRLANELSDYLVQHRREFRGDLIGVEQAVDEAVKIAGPVCLLDMGDNVGGGGTGDSTILAHAILSKNVAKPAFVCLYDPRAAAEARASGVSKKLTLKMGGGTDSLHGKPLELPVTVRAVTTGKYKESQVRHGGWSEFDMGPSAVVESDKGLTILLTSVRSMPSSLGMLTSCGLDPGKFQVLVAKGVQAPAAAYAPVCTKLIRVNTPGLTSADMTSFTYKYRRKPLYPFEEIG